MENTNKGIIFENNFFKAMQGKKQGVPAKISKFLPEFLTYTGPVTTIESVGGENSKRPIMKNKKENEVIKWLYQYASSQTKNSCIFIKYSA